MIQFKILKKSKKSRARLGLLKTEHGVVETPCLVPVATQAVVKTLDSREAKETKSQILICNTFHLHLKPGEDAVKKAGGLHQFMNWPRPLMTDSGGFQVFSLGFGKDFGMGKILNPVRSKTSSMPGLSLTRTSNGVKKKNANEIRYGQQPKLLKISQDGVYFRSFLDGKKVFLGPKESIKIQEKLRADIIFSFDECTSPIADYKYTKKSLERTNLWAEICLKEKKSRQSLFGIVQGGRYKDLRIESAKFIGSLDFDGFGIGGEFGNNKKTMLEMLNWVIKELPEQKPRHLLGIGYLADIPKIIERGADLFDCNVPTHYARRGIAFTRFGPINLGKSIYLNDRNPLDPVRNSFHRRGNGSYLGRFISNGVNKKCSCFVCQNYKRNYIFHLFRAKEITALKLLTFHNLYFFNSFIEKIRNKIKQGKI